MSKKTCSPHGPNELGGIILAYIREKPGMQTKHLLAKISAPRTEVMAMIRKLYSEARIQRTGPAVPFAWEINKDHPVEKNQTETGRKASEPNLQNIPIRTDEGKRIRDAFKRDVTGGTDERGETQGWIE